MYSYEVSPSNQDITFDAATKTISWQSTQDTASVGNYTITVTGTVNPVSFSSVSFVLSVTQLNSNPVLEGFPDVVYGSTTEDVDF